METHVIQVVGRATPLQEYTARVRVGGPIFEPLGNFVAQDTMPTSMRTRLSVVLEHIARRMCAVQNSCHYKDGYVDRYWLHFLPAAEEAYRAMLDADAGLI